LEGFFFGTEVLGPHNPLGEGRRVIGGKKEVKEAWGKGRASRKESKKKIRSGTIGDAGRGSRDEKCENGQKNAGLKEERRAREGGGAT